MALWETPWDYPDVWVRGLRSTPLTHTSGGSPRQFLENHYLLALFARNLRTPPFFLEPEAKEQKENTPTRPKVSLLHDQE